jgi:hypothetical protein
MPPRNIRRTNPDKSTGDSIGAIAFARGSIGEPAHGRGQRCCC